MVEVKDLRAVNNKKTFFLDARDEATGHNLRPVICVADIEGHILIIVPNSLISQKKNTWYNEIIVAWNIKQSTWNL